MSRLNGSNSVLRITVARSYTRKNIASRGCAVPVLFCECQRRVPTLVKHCESYLCSTNFVLEVTAARSYTRENNYLDTVLVRLPLHTKRTVTKKHPWKA